MEPSRANALCILAHHRNLVTITLGTVCQLCGSSRFRILPEWPVGAHSRALFNRRSAGLPRASWCSPSSEPISNAPGTNQSVNKANAAPSTHRDSERSIGGSSNVGCWSGSAQVELPHMRIRRSALGDDFSADACFDSDRDSGVSRPAGRLDASCLLSRLIAVSASALLLRGRALFCSRLLIDSPRDADEPATIIGSNPQGSGCPISAIAAPACSSNPGSSPCASRHCPDLDAIQTDIAERRHIHGSPRNQDLLSTVM